MAKSPLNKPVHPALYRKPPIAEVVPSTRPDVENPQPQQDCLPKEAPAVKTQLRAPKFEKPTFRQQSREGKLRIHLRTLWRHVPSLPEELEPPCETCETSACCKEFFVPLAQEEYESGEYAPYAVRVAAKAMQQLKRSINLPYSYEDPNGDGYYLEGMPGEYCPFFKNNKCSIYDKRPLTCRTYTCVTDPRITESLRKNDTR